MDTTKKRLTSVFITLSVLIILLFSGPASAITLNIARTDGTSNPYERDQVSFTGKVDLHTNDAIPIKTIDVLVDSTPSDSLSDATVCSFTLNGTPLANNSAKLCDITINSITKNYTNLGIGYGYAHGYGFNSSNTTTAVRDFTFGYGANYGYQSGFGYDTFNENLKSNSEIIVDFKWTAPTVSSNTDYKIALGVHAGTSHPTQFLSKTSVTLTVKNRASSSSFNTQTNDDETPSFNGINFQIHLTNPEISSIVLNLGKKLNSVVVEVHETPKGNIVVSAGRKVFKYLKVDLEDYAEQNLNYAKINFKVPKTWLKENGLTKEDIVMKRLTGSIWNELDTKYTGEDSVYYYYEATTPGFSYFAIGVKSNTVSQPITPSQPIIPPPPADNKSNVVVQKGCAQVITHAIDPNTGKCVDFATPCDVPKTWNIVDKCKAEFTKSGQRVEPEVNTGGLTPKEVSVILLTLIVMVFISWIIYRASNPRNPIDRYRRRKKYHYKRH